MWYVYVLQCVDGSLYTGSTNNLEKRFLEHKNGKGGHYTRSHKPVKLIYQEQFETQSEALTRESRIKSWRREKKIRILDLQFI
ncbi:GIY-YIG nuclease family protein [Candidatus Daviesbacteria bacterium]|nr:GIY-YIG nuclease family protein [Candidatus Daviesbacteria bacterium]